MTISSHSPEAWQKTRAYLLAHVPELAQDSTEEALMLRLDDEDWVLELKDDGILRCQAGYDLEEMKSILSDGTAEDLGTDELAKQVKFYLQQTTAKHRAWLIQEGCVERMEMNDCYVAVSFEQPVNLADPVEVARVIQSYLARFRRTR